jgi:hypothetical protein
MVENMKGTGLIIICMEQGFIHVKQKKIKNNSLKRYFFFFKK